MGLNVGNLASGLGGSIPVVGGAIETILDAFGGGGRTGDEVRRDIHLALNKSAFSKAMAGTMAAAEFLKGRGGQVTVLSDALTLSGGKDPLTFPKGQAQTPWPESDALADAASKYATVQAAASAGSGGAATALGPSGNTPATAAVDALKADAFAGLPLWAVLGLVGGMVYFVARRR